MPFDHANHATIANGLVFFGSSADNKVYALDLTTAREQWSFFADSPIRFAPVFHRGRLYVSSDDGYLYCLRAKTGKLIWLKRGGPAADFVLGNGRMISRWPTRGAATLVDDTIYFCAGIWPSEGIYIYAIEPKTGKVLWLNDSSGDILMGQPHGGAVASSGVSAQGYMSASGNTLLVPTGRAIPAAFNRDSGTFRHFHLQRYGHVRPGPFTVLTGGFALSANELFRAESGELLLKGTPGSSIAVFPKHVVFAQGNRIKGIDRSKLLGQQQIEDSQGNVKKRTVLGDSSWSIPCAEPLGVSLIGAGRTIVVGTKNHKVITADLSTKSVVMTANVDGDPLGLAAAEGCLVVSTDQGTIYCFGRSNTNRTVEISPKPKSSVYRRNRVYAKAAREIINRTGTTKGYCLDLGCGKGQLAYELSKHTDLYIYAVESDPVKAAKARRLLDEAGLYGTRVTVLQRNLFETKLPNYFANLIVSGASVKEGTDRVPQKEIDRILRPYGGSVCLGPPEEMRLTVRGPLEGAGSWTDQYCDPANTNCSADELVRGPLGMLWFTDNDFEMPSRHGRGPAPLCHDGRLFVEGLHGLRAIDAYNGRVLWEFHIRNILKAYDQEHLMGTAGTGSNFCVTAEGLYLRNEGKCLQLDPATGKLVSEFDAPKHPEGKESTWGYIACKNGTLFGTLADTEHIVEYRYRRSDMQTQFTESVLLFAIDVETGEPKWSYKPQYSIRNNTIAVGTDKVYFIDRPLALCDRPKVPHKNQQPKIKENLEDSSQPKGTLVALETDKGEIVWKSSEDIYGTMLALSEKHDVLLMAYQNTRFKLASEVGGRMATFGASTGKRTWDVEAHYVSRPILNDSTIYAEPGAWDLLTGKKKDFHFERSYGCGIISGSSHLLAFRSATLGYRDLLSDKGTVNYGGIRPGCWINAIPAAGLLLAPEASNRCTCSYLIKATIALQPIR
ncbi:MAG: PQQ-binding-like beta-propeller repeat protein [Phycisphaerales bacterium]|nr:MAG: PQQ-binding-like beta-propeller repeat protein [Phycisphaerales bacterium]